MRERTHCGIMQGMTVGVAISCSCWTETADMQKLFMSESVRGKPGIPEHCVNGHVPGMPE